MTVTTVVLCAAVVPSCTPASPPAVATADWPTYHHDNRRTGAAPGLPPPTQLAVAWRTRLDGAVFAQPLVVGGRLLVATENDTVHALDPDTGRSLWSTHVGEPMPGSDLACGNIDPLGITGTPVYDPATRLVFAVAETRDARHTLVGLDVATGRVRVRTSVDPPRGDRVSYQQRGALTLLGDRVYVPFGGLSGDCGDYVGTVVSVTTAGTGRRAFVVPAPMQAGIWSPGGGVLDRGRLLYTVGNGAARGPYDGSDSLVALDPDRLTPLDLFAPKDWAQENDRDLDLGATNPAVVGEFVFVNGKGGWGYVVHRDRLGGIGGQLHRVRTCLARGGTAVDGRTVLVPCEDGTLAVTIGVDGVPRRRWRAPVRTLNGSPTVGGGAVWVVDHDHGVLYALDRLTGTVLARVPVGAVPHFASPTLWGRRAYVGTLDGVVAVRGA